MTATNAPVRRLFELHRETIEQTGEILERAVELPLESGGGLDDVLATHRDIQTSLVDLARESTTETLATVETMLAPIPAGDVADFRGPVAEAFDTVEAQHARTFDAIESSARTVREDSTEQIRRQVDFLLEANEATEAGLRDVVEGLLAVTEEGGLVGPLDDQVGEFTRQLERSAEQLTDVDGRFETIDVTAPDE